MKLVDKKYQIIFFEKMHNIIIYKGLKRLE